MARRQSTSSISPLRQRVSPVWAPAVTAAGLQGLTFHDLRRAHAAGLVAAGIDVKTTQTRLGHSSSRLTLDLYAQSVARLDREEAGALGEAFMPDRPI